MSNATPETISTAEKGLIFYFRMTMAWTFLYAASHQVFVPSFTVVGFVQHTKTFHDVFAVFTTPAMAPITTFMVEYGHLLIGLSLLTGLMVRVSAAFGILLMVIYWFAHMAVHREHQQSDRRLSPRLCGRVDLPDRQAGRARVRSRRLGGNVAVREAAPGAQAFSRVMCN
jgi:uncharacterized membrane protein YphA (DoxX/SURF4 family)